jgi:Short C-terminal domain
MAEKPVGTAMQPSWRNGGVLLACTVLLACGSHSRSNNADALAALKSLRDQGVLTQAEYDTKVAALGDATAGGLGAGGGVEAAGPAPGGDGLPAAPEGGAGLAAGGNDFAGAAPAPAQHLPRAARTRAVAVGEPATANSGSAGLAAKDNTSGNSGNSGNGNSGNGNSRASAMRNLLAQARAKEAAVARSAHDLATRMLQRASSANPGAQHVPNAQDAEALRSYGQALMRGANPADAAAPSDAADNTYAPPR